MKGLIRVGLEKPKVGYDDRGSYSTESKRQPPFILLTLSVLFFDHGRDWLLGDWRQSKGVPPLASGIVKRLRMIRDSLIPDQHRSSFVADSTLEVCSLRYVIK